MVYYNWSVRCISEVRSPANGRADPGGASAQPEGWGSRIRESAYVGLRRGLLLRRSQSSIPNTLNKSPAYAALVVGYIENFLAFCLPKVPYKTIINSGEHWSTAYAVLGIIHPEDACKVSGWQIRWSSNLSASPGFIAFYLGACAPWADP
jgi:hypothetical protein